MEQNKGSDSSLIMALQSIAQAIIMSSPEWTVWTPTISSNTGTITTKSGTGKYLIIGKILFWRVQIIITTNGTGAGFIKCTLPVAAINADRLSGYGRANILSGKMLQAKLGLTTELHIYDYANAYPAASGETLELSGFYEIP